MAKPFLTPPLPQRDVAKIAADILDGRAKPSEPLGCEVHLEYDGVRHTFRMRCSVRNSSLIVSENVSPEQVQEIVAKMVALAMVQRVQED